MKTKTFDCVAMKRAGARAVREKTRGMTVAQEVAFWRRETAALRALQKSLPRRRRAKPAP